MVCKITLKIAFDIDGVFVFLPHPWVIKPSRPENRNALPFSFLQMPFWNLFHVSFPSPCYPSAVLLKASHLRLMVVYLREGQRWLDIPHYTLKWTTTDSLRSSCLGRIFKDLLSIEVFCTLNVKNAISYIECIMSYQTYFLYTINKSDAPRNDSDGELMFRCKFRSGIYIIKIWSLSVLFSP